MGLMRRGALFAGALFAGVLFGPQPQEAVEQSGGHWKHLLRAIASAETPELSVRADSRWKLRLPEVTQNYVVSAPFVSGKASGQWNVKAAVGVAAPPEVSAVRSCDWNLGTPHCGAAPAFLRVESTSNTGILAPECACNAPLVGFMARSYYTFATPKTVQNPTPEMILELFVDT